MKIKKTMNSIYFCTLSCGDHYVAFPSLSFDHSGCPMIDDTYSIYYVCHESGDFILEAIRDRKEVIDYFKELECHFY